MINYGKLILEKTNISPKTILEIGSRDGDDANILKEYFSISDSDIYVVEPNPNQQKKISHKYPDFNLIKKAIYNKSGKLKFNRVIDEELIGISSLLSRNDKIYDRIQSELIDVDVVTGDELLLNLPEIDLCKIDVEGSTYEVIESFGEKITKIKSFHIESEHKEVWTGQKLYDDVKLLLENLGYTQIYFEFVNGVSLQSDSIWVYKNYLK
jgi:FkbM family methyltransferase